METLTFALVALFILVFGTVSGKIARTVITAPMVFVAFGLLMGNVGFHVVDVDAESPFVHGIAELTLVLLLFTDAAHINLDHLRKDFGIPLRLLSIGLPLCILLGALAAIPLFPELGVWQAVVLAVILAPTDAALGQAVVQSTLVPERIRSALEVESGLNDGIALPFLVFFVCLAVGPEHNSGNWLVYTGKQLALGTLGGIAVGWSGAKVLAWGARTESISLPFQELFALGLSVFAFAGAELVGGNGFIAAFVGGLTLGNVNRNVCASLYEFAEAEGQLLTLLTFLFFGAAMLPEAIHSFSLHAVIYAVLSLTVVRMIAVAVATAGLKLKPAAVGFLGWNGPRGVASILYALLILEEEGLPAGQELFNLTMIVVALSVLAHGVTAWPGVKWFSKTKSAAALGGGKHP